MVEPLGYELASLYESPASRIGLINGLVCKQGSNPEVCCWLALSLRDVTSRRVTEAESQSAVHFRVGSLFTCKTVNQPYPWAWILFQVTGQFCDRSRFSHSILQSLYNNFCIIVRLVFKKCFSYLLCISTDPCARGDRHPAGMFIHLQCIM